ncbi:MAG: DUF58 domain-containing protein [Bacteroidia bacterium]
MLLEEIQSYSNFELLATSAKEGFVAGLHKSPFRGFSVEFAEHRPYNPGESVKNIDWKLLARTDKKYIKQFDEETNLKAHIWLDTSGSMRFPEKSESKLKFGTLAAGVIGGLLQQQKDSFSLGLYNNEGFYYKSACKSTRGHLQQQLLSLSPLWLSEKATQKTTTSVANQYMEEAILHVGRRQLVVILSDFLWGTAEAEAEASFWKYMAMLRFQKCEVLLIQIQHAEQEINLSFSTGNRPIKFMDLETNEFIKLQPDEIQMAYQQMETARNKEFNEKCIQLGIDCFIADVSKPIEQALTAFFVKRSKLH